MRRAELSDEVRSFDFFSNTVLSLVSVTHDIVRLRLFNGQFEPNQGIKQERTSRKSKNGNTFPNKRTNEGRK